MPPASSACRRQNTCWTAWKNAPRTWCARLLLPVQRIAEIFQRLAQEQVSIRDLRNILEAIIEWSPKEKDTVMLTEYVRGALKRQISYMYSKG